MQCFTILTVLSYCSIKFVFSSVFLFFSYYKLIQCFLLKSQILISSMAKKISDLIYYRVNVIIWFSKPIHLNVCSGKQTSILFNELFSILKVTYLLKHNTLLKLSLLLHISSLNIADTRFSITALSFWAHLISDLDKALLPAMQLCFASCVSSLQTHWKVFWIWTVCYYANLNIRDFTWDPN